MWLATGRCEPDTAAEYSEGWLKRLAKALAGVLDDRAEEAVMSAERHGALWDASECALVFIDYQDSVLADVWEQDRRVVELHARTLATAAVGLDVPVVLSTIAVEAGFNTPMLASLAAAVPDVKPIDRFTMNAWEYPPFLEAVVATGRKRLVMCGLMTSICLAYSAVSALADGYEVAFVANAVADITKEQHEIGLLRLAHAGAIPNTSPAIISEWFLDWSSPSAEVARNLYPPFFEEWSAMKRAPERYEPKGLG
jgi:nicotinamidase-related amidase